MWICRFYRSSQKTSCFFQFFHIFHTLLLPGNAPFSKQLGFVFSRRCLHFPCWEVLWIFFPTEKNHQKLPRSPRGWETFRRWATLEGLKLACQPLKACRTKLEMLVLLVVPLSWRFWKFPHHPWIRSPILCCLLFFRKLRTGIYELDLLLTQDANSGK